MLLHLYNHSDHHFPPLSQCLKQRRGWYPHSQQQLQQTCLWILDNWSIGTKKKGVNYKSLSYVMLCLCWIMSNCQWFASDVLVILYNCNQYIACFTPPKQGNKSVTCSWSSAYMQIEQTQNTKPQNECSWLPQAPGIKLNHTYKLKKCKRKELIYVYCTGQNDTKRMSSSLHTCTCIWNIST